MTTEMPTPADLLAYTPAQQRALDVFIAGREHKDFQLMEVEAYRETFACMTISRQAAIHTMDYYLCISLLLRGKGTDGVSHDDVLKTLIEKYDAVSLLRMDLTEAADDYFDTKYIRSTVKELLHHLDVGFRKEIRRTVCLALGTQLDDGTKVDQAIFTTNALTKETRA